MNQGVVLKKIHCFQVEPIEALVEIKPTVLRWFTRLLSFSEILLWPGWLRDRLCPAWKMTEPE